MEEERAAARAFAQERPSGAPTADVRPSLQTGAFGVLLLFLTQFGFGVLLGIVAGLMLAGRGEPADETDIRWVIVWASAFAMVALMLWIGRDLRRSGVRARGRAIGLLGHELPLDHAAAWVLGTFVVVRVATSGYFLLAYPDLNSIAESFERQLQLQPLGGAFGVTTVVWIGLIALIAPLIEEILFRGYLQTALLARLPGWGAIGVAAAVFASLHFSLALWPALFFLGLGLGAVYHYTGSLWPAIALHALNNWVALGAFYLGGGGAG